MGSEPAAALEHSEERYESDDLRADAEAEEDRPAADVADHPAEILAKETGDEADAEEDLGNHGQLLHDGVEAVGNGGEVDVHRPGEAVAVAGLFHLR